MLRGIFGSGGGAPVGGTGTTNTIPRWTGPSTLGDSGLIDDGSAVYTTTRFIGIGRSTAIGTNCRLNVQLAGSTASGYTAPSNAAALFDCGVAANGGIGLVGGGALGYYFGNASDGYDGGVEYISRILYLRGKGTRALAVDGGNVGIGTASPVGRTDIAGTSVDQLAWGLLSVRSSDAQGADKGGSLAFGGLYDATNSTHWAQISGRKENGTSGQYGGYLAFATRTNGAGANTERARIDSAGNLILNTANTGATIQAAGTSQGLKLPATPGNADTQTLDCYRENTWTPTITGLGNCSAVTISDASFTQIGRLVTIQGKIDLTVTAATTATSFQFSLPVNRGTTTLAGCGAAVDNTNFAMGGVYNAGANNTTAYVVFPAAAGFGAGSARIWAFSYSYFTAT